MNFKQLLIPLFLIGAMSFIVNQKEDIYSEIPKEHFTAVNNLLYSVSLQLPSIKPSEVSNRNTQIYVTDSNKTYLLDPWLQYYSINGTVPCEPVCDTNLFVHTTNGVTKLNIDSIVNSETDVCGNLAPKIWVEHPVFDSTFLYVSSMKGSQENSFRSAESLRINEWPKDLDSSIFKIPTICRNKRITLFEYQDGTMIAEVVADSFPENHEGYKDAMLTISTWEALYFVSKGDAKIITPPAAGTQFYYGTDYRFIGLEDMNGDGEPDILAGEGINIFLERYKDGFRSWGFPFPPPGGC